MAGAQFYGDNMSTPVEAFQNRLRRFFGRHLPNLPPSPVQNRPVVTRPLRRVLNATATTVSERQAQVAASTSIIPIVYGLDRIGGMIGPVFWVGVEGAPRIVFTVFWCMGEIQSIEKLYKDGEELIPTFNGAVTHYTGSATQGIDPLLAANLPYSWAPNYTDDYVLTVGAETVGIAYSVIILEALTLTSFPRFEAIIKGRKIYDPRLNQMLWTDNPTLHLADFLTSQICGRGQSLDWDSVIPVADRNDQRINGIKRRTSGVTLLNPQSVDIWTETLRGYAGCFVIADNSILRLVADAPTSASRTLTNSNIIGDPIIRKQRRRDSPTVVRVYYTAIGDDWSDAYQDAALPGVAQGIVPHRLQTIRLPGIQNPSQAYREAVERLNVATLADLTVTLQTHDEGVGTVIGDVHDVSTSDGLANKLLRVEAHRSIDIGRWETQYIEYDPAVYSDAIVTAPTTPDIVLPDPAALPIVTGITLAEEIFTLQDGTRTTRLVISWNSVDYAYAHAYRVHVQLGSRVEQSLSTAATTIRSRAVEEQRTYTVSITAVADASGFEGPDGQAAIFVQGSYIPPGNVPWVSGQRFSGDEALLQWGEVEDVGLMRYEIRNMTGGISWEQGYFLGTTTDNSMVTRVGSLGTKTFGVKALDNVGLYSASEVTTEVVFDGPATVMNFGGFEAGGIVFLEWDALDGFVEDYLVRYGPIASFTWASGTDVFKGKANRAQITGLARGTYRFAVKALDGFPVPNESANWPWIDITVTHDNFSAPESGACYSLETDPVATVGLVLLEIDGREVFVATENGIWSDVYILPMKEYPDPLISYEELHFNPWGTAFSGAMQTYTEPLISYQTQVPYKTGEWFSKEIDFGRNITAAFTVTTDITTYTGPPPLMRFWAYEETSPGVYSSQILENQAVFMAQAWKVKVQIGSGTQGECFSVYANHVKLQVNQPTSVENLTGTSLSSGVTTVNLANYYFSTLDVSLVPVASSPRIAVIDNIVVGAPVPNADFDIGTDGGKCAKWARHEPGEDPDPSAAPIRDTVNSYYGPASAFAQGIGTYLSRAFYVQPDSTFDVSLWVKGTTGVAAVSIYLSHLSIFPDIEYIPKNYGVYAPSPIVENLVLVAGWQEVTQTVTIPSAMNYASVVVEILNSAVVLNWDHIRFDNNRFDVIFTDKDGVQQPTDFIGEYKGVLWQE